MISTRERLIVALDVSSSADALKIVSRLGDSVQTYKVGMQLYGAEGPKIVRDLISTGKSVFLDLKYHDIPNTVAAAVREAAHFWGEHDDGACLRRIKNVASGGRGSAKIQ